MKEKLESLMHDMERYSREYSRSTRIPKLSDHIKGKYEGASQAYATCAKRLKEIMEDRA